MKQKILFSLGSLFLALPAVVLAQVQTQITITFNSLSGSTHGVPLSPWMSGITVLMLIAVAYFFLRKQVNQGFLMVLFAALVGVVSLSPKITEAIMSPTPLVNSPTNLEVGPLNCGLNPYVFVNGQANSLLINSVSLTPSQQGVSIDPSSTCIAGTILASSQQCTVVVIENCV